MHLGHTGQPCTRVGACMHCSPSHRCPCVPPAVPRRKFRRTHCALAATAGRPAEGVVSIVMDLPLPCPPCRRAVSAGARALLWRGHPGAAAAVPADEQPLRRVGSLLPVRGRQLRGRLPAGPSPTQGWRASCFLFLCQFLASAGTIRLRTAVRASPRGRSTKSGRKAKPPPRPSQHTRTDIHTPHLTLPLPQRPLLGAWKPRAVPLHQGAPLPFPALQGVVASWGGGARAGLVPPDTRRELRAASAPRLVALSAVRLC